MPTMLSLLELSSDSLRLNFLPAKRAPKELLRNGLKNCLFVNAYGPTETTVCATLAFYDPQSDDEPTIGRPIAHTQFYILDENMCSVPDNSQENYIFLGSALL